MANAPTETRPPRSVDPEAADRPDRLLFEQLSEGFAVHEMIYDEAGRPRDYRFLDVNPAFERVTGLSREQVVGRTVLELLPGTEPFWIETYAKVAETGTPAVFQHRHEQLGKWFEVRAFRPRRGQFAVLFLDVTERKRAEEDQAILGVLAERSENPLVYLDRDFNFLRVNRAYARSCRREPEEFIGRNHFELYPHEENQRIFERVRDTGVPAVWREKPFEFPDQPERGVTYWDWTLTPIRGGGGVVTGLVFSLVEVTEKVRARVAAENDKRRLEAVMEALPVGVAITDARGGNVLSNQAFDRLWGAPRPDTRTVDDYVAYRAWWADGGGPVAPEQWASALVLAHGVPVTGQVFEIERFDGSRAFVLNGAAPVRDASGAIVGSAVAIQDVTELRRAEQALRESEARLKEADLRKDEFLAMLSHELRNPLMPIRNSLYVLQRAAPGGEESRRAQVVIERQVRQLSRLVDDLLDVVRISSGKIHLQPERVELGELTLRTAEDHRAIFAAREVELSVEVPGRGLWLRADPARLAQVIGNLLHNAAKFTPGGGRVALTLQEEGGLAVLRVRDTGVGIAPEMLRRIFDPFAQADTSLDRSRGGLGLGLALVKALVGLHRGSVACASEGLGRGATFTVELPIEGAPAREPAPVAAPAPRARRVLVIEDNVDAAESLRDVLALDGHEVAVAHAGPAGIERARAFRPEVVICDIGLPGMDGFAVARALRADEALRRAFLIALSGYALREDVRNAERAGFDRHLAKPVSPEALAAALAEAGCGDARGDATRSASTPSR